MNVECCTCDRNDKNIYNSYKSTFLKFIKARNFWVAR